MTRTLSTIGPKPPPVGCKAVKRSVVDEVAATNVKLASCQCWVSEVDTPTVVGMVTLCVANVEPPVPCMASARKEALEPKNWWRDAEKATE